MIKIVTILLTMVLLVQTSYGATPTIRVSINGCEVSFTDGKPFMDNSSRILVPIRLVSEQLGAEVGWDKETQTITIKEENKVVTLVIDKKEININGKAKQLDTNATLRAGRTYVPIRFISEALGAGVTWDGEAGIVYINNGKEPIPQTEMFRAGPFSVSSEGVKHLRVNVQEWSLYTEGDLGINGNTVIDATRCIITIHLRPYSNEQCDEATSILKQAISEDGVNEIMNFVKMKTGDGITIGNKNFYDGQYRIRPDDALSSSGVHIRVHYNE